MPGTILYVDMQPDLPEGLGRALGGLGFRLRQTPSVDDALALVRDGAAQLVMVEVLLDGGRGWELIRRIRQLERPRGEVPIIVLTRGERTPKLYARAVELGANDFLSRPVLRAEILNAILECVEAGDSASPVDPVLAAGAGAMAGDASGGLADVPLPEILLHLRDSGATGVLFLQDFESVLVQLRNGSPIGVSSSRGDETFADFLVRTKRISGDEHDALLDRVHATGESEPRAAMSIRALSRHEVQAALADQAAEPLLEAFAWSSGSWRFERGRRLRSGRALDHGALRMLVEGVLQWASSRSIRAMLDRRGALYLSKVERPPCTLEELAPGLCERGLLDSWLGDRTFADVLDSGEIGERELYALLIAGLVEGRSETLLELSVVVGSAPVKAKRPAPELELDEQREPATSAESVESTVVVPEPPGGEESATTVADAPPPADAGAVSEPPAEASDADRSNEAERYFRDGETHLDAGRYDKAVESFGMSAHLDPNQGEYRAHLGYAMYLQSPESDLVRREALEHIAKGIKLAPEQWKPLLYLGRVFIAVGERTNARKVLLSAVRRHPECEPLAEELRRLKLPRSEAKSGIVGRLKRWLGK